VLDLACSRCLEQEQPSRVPCALGYNTLAVQRASRPGGRAAAQRAPAARAPPAPPDQIGADGHSSQFFKMYDPSQSAYGIYGGAPPAMALQQAVAAFGGFGAAAPQAVGAPAAGHYGIVPLAAVGGPPPQSAPVHQAQVAVGPGGMEEPRTVYLSGFPGDVRERELNNLLRFLPGYQASQLNWKNGQVRPPPGKVWEAVLAAWERRRPLWRPLQAGAARRGARCCARAPAVRQQRYPPPTPTAAPDATRTPHSSLPSPKTTRMPRPRTHTAMCTCTPPRDPGTATINRPPPPRATQKKTHARARKRADAAASP
jgi:hypothetical protein